MRISQTLSQAYVAKRSSAKQLYDAQSKHMCSPCVQQHGCEDLPLPLPLHTALELIHADCASISGIGDPAAGMDAHSHDPSLRLTCTPFQAESFTAAEKYEVETAAGLGSRHPNLPASI